MGSANQVDVVAVRKFVHDIFSKCEGDTAVIFSPLVNFLIGVTPKQITEKSGVGHVGGPHNILDRFDLVEFGRETSVHTQDLIVDERSNWQAIEAVCEHLPQFNSVSSFALIIKSVNAVNTCTLVVATEEEEVLGELDLVSEKETHCF